MSVTILVCSCGRRLKAGGLAPGQKGRCPSCGASIQVPGPGPAPPQAGGLVEEDEWNWQGTYDLGEAVRPLPLRRREPDPIPTPASSHESITPDDFWSNGLEPSKPSSDSAVHPERRADDEWDWHGTAYQLGPNDKPAATSAGDIRPPAEDDGPAPIPAPIGWTTPASGGKSTPQEPESWFPPRLFYPLRGAEALMPVVSIGLACWVMGTLVPSYCLTLQADAEMLGAPLMGYLIGLITALPSLMGLPLVLVYWLQYLGRVLTAAFEGERHPPRPPDRNFDGLLNGLSLWLLWGVLGLGVGALPLGACWAAATKVPALAPFANPTIALGTILFGFLYATMAFLIVFLHDDPLEANPARILGRVGRLFPSFLGLSLTAAILFGLVGAAFMGTFLLRSQSVWLFITASLPCWLLTVWISIVTMQMLGSYYGAHSPTARPSPSRRPERRTTSPGAEGSEVRRPHPERL